MTAQCWRVEVGDCVEMLAGMDACSVDAVVCDPPYALPGGFMAKPWDCYDGREDAGFAYWLAGLIDGEGCFTIKAHTRVPHAPVFSLHMRADEEGTLRLIERTLRIGSITHTPPQPHPMVRWTVQDKAGCQRLVDLLDKYPLRAKKRMDYVVWRDAVCEWTARPRGNRWHGAADNTRMATLRDRLTTGRGYVEPAWSGHEYQDWCRIWARECLRVLKPGGHLLAFGGTRTYHRLTCAIEDAGFEVRDCIAWMYGSGFPKSLDVSKAIDKAAGAEREVIGTYRVPADSAAGNAGQVIRSSDDAESVFGVGTGLVDGRAITAPATPDAERWAGWGTALKPAFEPIVVARKPLAGTVAGNVLAHGTGALNVDGCRIGETTRTNASAPRHEQNGFVKGFVEGTASVEHAHGRWPANVAFDPEAAALLDEQTGTLTSGSGPLNRNGDKFRNAYGAFAGGDELADVLYGDSGGASRFFYCPKTSSAERNAGLDGFEAQETRTYGDLGPDENARPHGQTAITRRNVHPTVKPIELMRWLVRLVTPLGGTVLDPFAGSGTTGCAAVLEGFDFFGIEREPEYVAIAEARIAWWARHPDGMRLVTRLEREQERVATAAAGQGSLFDDVGGDDARDG